MKVVTSASVKYLLSVNLSTILIECLTQYQFIKAAIFRNFHQNVSHYGSCEFIVLLDQNTAIVELNYVGMIGL
jgi:hypothetical protein